MSIFFCHEHASMFFIFVRKYRKYSINRWRVLHVRSVCFRGVFTIKAVVAFLRKLAWQMCHILKHLFICNTFSCGLGLLFYMQIVLALVCCRNPNTFHRFGTIFPNKIFVCILLRRPSDPAAIRRMEKLPKCQTFGWSQWEATKHQHCNGRMNAK